ncbi:TlpA family protein disulfide reductase [Plantactinospora sp. WMMB334]|uniref:TlpA family protein disulfide reductase n=1 Tax=Plantactinospora sp. WMMB334 TaxID=3404119 RepID=UPI003B949B9C
MSPLPGALLVLALLAGTGACTGSERDAEPETGAAPADGRATTTAFADCGDVTAPLSTSPAVPGMSAGSGTPAVPGRSAGPGTPAVPGRSAGSGASAGSGSALPAVRLPCFSGETEVAVGELRGPAVINLWASWCPPCRRELPAFQRLSARAGDRLRVIGVNTRDSWPAAESIGVDFGLEFPSLYDRDQTLLRELGGRAVLPITLFVDADGRIRHRDETGALDDAALTALVRRHLGVAVPS